MGVVAGTMEAAGYAVRPRAGQTWQWCCSGDAAEEGQTWQEGQTWRAVVLQCVAVVMRAVAVENQQCGE